MKALWNRTGRTIRGMLSRRRPTSGRRPTDPTAGPLHIDAPKPLDPDPRHERDAAAARERVVRLVAELAPRGTDEGTATALDNMINYWADGWLADIETERLNAHTVVDALVGEVMPKQERLRMGCEGALDRLRLARENHELARALLAGEAAPADRHPREG
ncbi:hypothetical protein [Micromonospora wenchangensis]|uniref:hypothetical protein n=1 Tax=Micromonospora wenchangensis TaxID=1185415 RepID=UPI003D72EA21